MAETELEPDEWSKWWNARVAAIETVLGKSDDVVLHAVIPFQFGHQAGGAADVICFRKHVPGIVAVTSELIGEDSQVRNDIGNYELMICQRDDIGWGANLLARLAYSTLESRLNPGETMDIGSATPEGSTIAALLFLEYARFEVRGRAAGLLLCIGITGDELQACFDGHRHELELALKEAGVFPFTDLYRKSVLEH